MKGRALMVLLLGAMSFVLIADSKPYKGRNQFEIEPKLEDDVFIEPTEESALHYARTYYSATHDDVQFISRAFDTKWLDVGILIKRDLGRRGLYSDEMWEEMTVVIGEVDDEYLVLLSPRLYVRYMSDDPDEHPSPIGARVRPIEYRIDSKENKIVSFEILSNG